jgi:hypothetical protein
LTSQVMVPVRNRERRVYFALAVVAAVLVFAGFARTYYLKGLFAAPALRPLVHLHGAIFTSWFALLFAQLFLVSRRRTDVHRRLGVLGGCLAATMVVVGIATAISAAARGATVPGVPPLAFLAVPLFDILVFAIVIGAAFYHRARPATHKRLMIAGTIGILPPAVARLPFDWVATGGPLVYFGVPDLILLAVIAWDTLTHRRLHPAFLWSGLVVILSHPLRLFIAGTAAWLSFARWLTGA